MKLNAIQLDEKTRAEHVGKPDLGQKSIII